MLWEDLSRYFSDLEVKKLINLVPINGVRLGTTSAGILDNTEPDLVGLELQRDCNLAGVFTSSTLKAAPVKICERNLSLRSPEYIIVNTGIANSGTGKQGLIDAESVCKYLAEITNSHIEAVMPCSTGKVGEYLPVKKILTAIPKALKNLSPSGWSEAAQGILTIDSGPKGTSKTIMDDKVNITGIVKGSGMIKPNMATMLAFIATDAKIDQELLNYALTQAVNKTFNRLTIDRDTSTNDSAFLIATGKSGVVVDDGNFDIFYSDLVSLFDELALAIIKDPVDAKHILEISVINAASEFEASRIAFEIAESLSVKTAISNRNPFWGYILVAIGHVNLNDLNEKKINIWINENHVVIDGCVNPHLTGDVDDLFDEVLAMKIDLARGLASERVLSNEVLHHAI